MTVKVQLRLLFLLLRPNPHPAPRMCPTETGEERESLQLFRRCHQPFVDSRDRTLKNRPLLSFAIYHSVWFLKKTKFGSAIQWNQSETVVCSQLRAIRRSCPQLSLDHHFMVHASCHGPDSSTSSGGKARRATQSSDYFQLFPLTE